MKEYTVGKNKSIPLPSGQKNAGDIVTEKHFQHMGDSAESWIRAAVKAGILVDNSKTEKIATETTETVEETK